LTGMGQTHALEAAQHVLPERPDICISAGLAGALQGEYKAGDVLAARLVSEVDEPVAVASHRDLLSAAKDCGARQIERFVTSNTLVTRADEKRYLGAQAEAVEMESYVILAEAARCGVPAVAIRAISDSADFNLPYDLANARDAHGQIRLSGVLAQVLRRPSGLPALMRLARDCRHAARQLAEFLEAYTGTLSGRMISIEPDMVAAE
jgi:adenosylhomocysteine nucleosidase